MPVRYPMKCRSKYMAILTKLYSYILKIQYIRYSHHNERYFIIIPGFYDKEKENNFLLYFDPSVWCFASPPPSSMSKTWETLDNCSKSKFYKSSVRHFKNTVNTGHVYFKLIVTINLRNY